MLSNSAQDNKTVINELCASFERQLLLYKELRDGVRTHLSSLILSRGDAGVLNAGINKKVKILDKINQERAEIAEHIEYWQKHRESLSSSKSAAALDNILTQTEEVIKNFLIEEEKLKQYVEKMYKKDDAQ